MGEYNDQQLTCAGCNRDFTWTAGEQEFFHESEKGVGSDYALRTG